MISLNSKSILKQLGSALVRRLVRRLLAVRRLVGDQMIEGTPIGANTNNADEVES